MSDQVFQHMINTDCLACKQSIWPCEDHEQLFGLALVAYRTKLLCTAPRTLGFVQFGSAKYQVDEIMCGFCDFCVYDDNIPSCSFSSPQRNETTSREIEVENSSNSTKTLSSPVSNNHCFAFSCQRKECPRAIVVSRGEESSKTVTYRTIRSWKDIVDIVRSAFQLSFIDRELIDSLYISLDPLPSIQSDFVVSCTKTNQYAYLLGNSEESKDVNECYDCSKFISSAESNIVWSELHDILIDCSVSLAAPTLIDVEEGTAYYLCNDCQFNSRQEQTHPL